MPTMRPSPPDTFAVTTPSDHEACITRSFAAPRPLVFAAFTTPDLVRRWMLGPPGFTMPVCEIDLRPGGLFRYVWRKPSGTEMGMGGRFVEVVAPERLVHVEIFDQDWTGGETRVTTAFAEHDGVTTVTMTVRYASLAARDGALATGMTSGMTAGYLALDALLAGQA